jgi:hypothetical protein
MASCVCVCVCVCVCTRARAIQFRCLDMLCFVCLVCNSIFTMHRRTFAQSRFIYCGLISDIHNRRLPASPTASRLLMCVPTMRPYSSGWPKLHHSSALQNGRHTYVSPSTCIHTYTEMYVHTFICIHMCVHPCSLFVDKMDAYCESFYAHILCTCILYTYYIHVPIQVAGQSCITAQPYRMDAIRTYRYPFYAYIH